MRAVVKGSENWAQETSEFSTQTAMDDFSLKFQFPSRPGGQIPDLPFNLDEMGDADLMSLYAEFMTWLSYSKAELVKAEIEEERQANNCRVLEAEILIGQWSDSAKGDTVTLAKARRDANPEVVHQQSLHLNARAYRKLVESVFDRCERGAQLMSRELSRRIGLAPKESRSARYLP